MGDRQHLMGNLGGILSHMQTGISHLPLGWVCISTVQLEPPEMLYLISRAVVWGWRGTTI